jgi:hypothetical protein
VAGGRSSTVRGRGGVHGGGSLGEKVGKKGCGDVVDAWVAEIWFLWLGSHRFGRSSTGGHGAGLLVMNGKKEGNKDMEKEMAGQVRFEE